MMDTEGIIMLGKDPGQVSDWEYNMPDEAMCVSNGKMNEMVLQDVNLVIRNDS